jgi:hypothetical protein
MLLVGSLANYIRRGKAAATAARGAAAAAETARAAAAETARPGRA